MAADPAQARATLAHFQRRGERVLGSAAAKCQDIASIGSTMRVVFEGPRLVSRRERSHLPGAEMLESAVLLRPLYFNKGDSVYVTNVGSALTTLTRDAAPRVIELTRNVRRAIPKTLESERWSLMVAADGSGQKFSNTQIAELYFDAEVWHSDLDKQKVLRHVSEDERSICATVWVSERLLLTKALLQFIDDLDAAGHL